MNSYIRRNFESLTAFIFISIPTIPNYAHFKDFKYFLNETFNEFHGNKFFLIII